MQDQDFDRFTRALASGVGRRQVLKALAGGLVGGLVALIAGRLPVANSESPARPAAGGPIFLPILTNNEGPIPVNPCGTDFPNATTMLAAKTALGSGQNDVSLSPGGCWNFKRTVSGSQVTHEEITQNGQVSLVWDSTTTQATGKRDSDLDGFFEWQATLTKGATVSGDQEVYNYYSPVTHAMVGRVTLTRTNDVVHVVWEQADSNGTLQTIDHFDTGPIANLETAGPPSPPVAQPLPTSCTADQQALLQQRLNEAFWGSSSNNNYGGVECLRQKGVYDLMNDLMDVWLHANITLDCASLGSKNGAPIAASTSYLRIGWWFIGSVATTVNSDIFFTFSSQYQTQILFHEMLHIPLGAHDADQEASACREQVDRIYACAATCFNPLATKCSCATCLQTNKCDYRCKGYADNSSDPSCPSCPDVLGAYCPCKPNAKWYPTCSDCLAKCPSGLSCFGIHYCIPQDIGCNKSTCP